MLGSQPYFPNLNGLRFLAALLVIVHHIEQYKGLLGMESSWEQFAFLKLIGPLGVILFFVLSGFLITYLLMAEEDRFQRVQIGHFYMRRVLRIWPLYFLILFVAFAIMPHIRSAVWIDYPPEVVYSHWPQKLALYIFFLPNLIETMYGAVPYASHLWSIGAEEQFYLIWPLIFCFAKRYRFLVLCLIVFLHPMVGAFLSTKYATFIPNRPVVIGFWSSFNMNCMAIGSILGILLFKKSMWMKWLLNKYLLYAAIISAMGLIAWGGQILFLHYTVYATLFGIIILNFAANKSIGLSLEFAPFHYLGKISYGLYMFHPIGIIIGLRLAEALHLYTNWVIYPLVLSITIGIAALSFRFYESQFMKLRGKFIQAKAS